MQLTKTLFVFGTVFAASAIATDSSSADSNAEANITESQLWQALESYFHQHPVNLTQINLDLDKHHNETKSNATAADDHKKHNGTSIDDSDKDHKKNGTDHGADDKHKPKNGTKHNDDDDDGKTKKNGTDKCDASKPAAHKIFEEREPVRCCKCPWSHTAKETEKIQIGTPHAVLDFSVELNLPSVLECCQCPEEKVKSTKDKVHGSDHKSTTAKPKASATKSGFETVTTIKA